MISSSRATLIGGIALLLWSTLALFASIAGTIPPFQMVAMAFSIAAATGLAKRLILRQPVLPLLRQPGQAWALSVAGLFGYHFFYFVALRLAPPLEANLLNYLWPLLIVLFSSWFGGAGRLRLPHVIGIACGLAGAVLLIGRGRGIGFDPAFAAGYGAAITCAVIWALYSVLNRRFAFVPTDAVTGFCAATAILAFACHLGFETWVSPQGWQWVGVIGLGLGPVGVAFFAWDYGCKHGHIRTLGSAAYGVPLLSNGLLIVFGEGELTWTVAVAALLIIGGGALGAIDGGVWRRLLSGLRERRTRAS